MAKHQALSTKSQESTKHQIPRKTILELRILGFFSAWVLGFSAFAPLTAFAVPADLHYQYYEQVFTLKTQKAWRETIEVPTFRGVQLSFAEGEKIPAGVVMQPRAIWNREKIAAAIEETIGSAINRERGHVRIFRDEKGEIAFEGFGITGRKLDPEQTLALTLVALDNDIPLVQLVVAEEGPELIVEDEELTKQGIKELVAIGESDYTGSPNNRKHNIGVGLARFNGHVIPEGEEFSFNEVLGPVNQSTGYRPELTIVGEKTLPEFGGGLCQVSTTAYRGAWRAGFPITERRNHSYAVRYYFPPGTDATIYPPATDIRFANDTEGSLLIQTHAENSLAYFFYYGTKPKERSVELVGPFTWDPIKPPPDKMEYTTEIPPGETRIVSKPVPGMKAAWYRYIRDENEERKPEEFLSYYEARPYFEEIGVEALMESPSIVKAPEREIRRIGEDTTITLPRNIGSSPRIRIRR